MYICLHVQYPLFLSDLNENPSSGSRLVPCGLIYMTKLIVAFRNLRTRLKRDRADRKTISAITGLGIKTASFIPGQPFERIS